MKKRMLLVAVCAAMFFPVWSEVYGDVNGDGRVDVEDVNEVVNVILRLPHGGDHAIIVNPESLAFSGEVGGIYTQDVVVTGDNLHGAVNAVVMGGDGAFGVSPSNASLSSVQGGAIFTVTYAPQSAGMHTASLLLTSEGATAVRVPLTGTATSASGAGTETYTVNGVSFTMVSVEGGTFTMGATSEQGDYYDSDERPTHEVTLSSYSIGQTEVTQALWVAVMGSNPSWFNSTGNSDYGSYHSNYDYGTNLQRPVEQVSWNDCQTFIKKLNQLIGKTFRLPTEAEWEYAARGGNKSQGYKYAGSNTVGDVAWYRDNIPSQSEGTSGYGTQTVGTKQANELGLYDMSGNVCEWCQDWYGSYSSGAQTNPTGPTSGSNRVNRCGDWDSFARDCRVSYRGCNTPTYRYRSKGLRLAQ